MTVDEITRHFHLKIPISREMGLQVTEVSSKHAVVAVPLAPNVNHVQTAFGGSLYAAAALSCYALFQALAREAGGLSDELVIQEGGIRYLFPVTGDFTVRAEMAEEDGVGKFIEALRRSGKARMKLKASVICQGRTCAEFSGTYVFKSPKGN